MLFKNPGSRRENPFRRLYDDEEYKNVLLHRDRLPEFPRLVDIELTNHCNLRCVFCGHQAMVRERGYIEEDIVRKLVDECVRYGSSIRMIRWGEPFLHPKIAAFCEYIKSNALLLHITNNGLAITETHMRSLVDLGVDSVIFSFQGATKDQYELMRNNHRYDDLKANILRMLEIRADKPKPFIHISSTMTDETDEQVQSFVQYWGHLVDSVGVGKTNLSRLAAHQIRSLEALGKLETLRKQETIKKRHSPCTEVYQKLSVDSDAKVTCCCGDYDRYMTVGDAHVSTLYDIWNQGAQLRVFRHLLDNMMHRSLTLCSTCYHTYEEF